MVTLSEDAVAYASGSGVCIVTLSTGAMVFHEARPPPGADGGEKAFLGGVSALASCGEEGRAEGYFVVPRFLDTKTSYLYSLYTAN